MYITWHLNAPMPHSNGLASADVPLSPAIAIVNVVPPPPSSRFPSEPRLRRHLLPVCPLTSCSSWFLLQAPLADAVIGGPAAGRDRRHADDTADTAAAAAAALQQRQWWRGGRSRPQGECGGGSNEPCPGQQIPLRSCGCSRCIRAGRQQRQQGSTAAATAAISVQWGPSAAVSGAAAAGSWWCAGRRAQADD